MSKNPTTTTPPATQPPTTTTTTTQPPMTTTTTTTAPVLPTGGTPTLSLGDGPPVLSTGGTPTLLGGGPPVLGGGVPPPGGAPVHPTPLQLMEWFGSDPVCMNNEPNVNGVWNNLLNHYYPQVVGQYLIAPELYPAYRRTFAPPATNTTSTTASSSSSSSSSSNPSSSSSSSSSSNPRSDSSTTTTGTITSTTTTTSTITTSSTTIIMPPPAPTDNRSRRKRKESSSGSESSSKSSRPRLRRDSSPTTFVQVRTPSVPVADPINNGTLAADLGVMEFHRVGNQINLVPLLIFEGKSSTGDNYDAIYTQLTTWMEAQYMAIGDTCYLIGARGNLVKFWVFQKRARAQVDWRTKSLIVVRTGDELGQRRDGRENKRDDGTFFDLSDAADRGYINAALTYMANHPDTFTFTAP